MVLMVHQRVNQAHDGHQHHAEEQGVNPAAVRFARRGLGRHGRSGLKKIAR